MDQVHLFSSSLTTMTPRPAAVETKNGISVVRNNGEAAGRFP